MKKFLTMLVMLFAVFTLQFATPTYAQEPAITVVVQWDHPGIGSAPQNDDLAGFEVRAYEVTGTGDFVMDIYHDGDEDGVTDIWGVFDDRPDPTARETVFEIADPPVAFEFKVSALAYDDEAIPNKSVEAYSEVVTIQPLAPDAPGQVIIINIGASS